MVRRGARRDAGLLARRRRRPRRRALPLRGPEGAAATRSDSTSGWAASRPSELRRVGRLADGWLPSFVTPADAAAGRAVIEQVAAEHEREIEDDHYGVLIPYSMDSVPDLLLAQLGPPPPRPRRSRRRWSRSAGTRSIDTVKRFVDVGTTKFVVLPITEPRASTPGRPTSREAAEALLPLEDPDSSSARPSAAIAALRPGIADTPPPRRAPAPHTNTLACARLDAPPADVGRRPRRTATAGRRGRCARPACRGAPRPRAGPSTSMHSGASRQSSIGSASTLSSDAQHRRAGAAPAAPTGSSRNSRAGMCRANSVRVCAPAACSVGAEDRRVGQRVAVDLARHDVGDARRPPPAGTPARAGRTPR